MEEMKELFERIDKMSEEVNVDAVFGEPREVGDHVLIPIAELKYGFGLGSGTAEGMKQAEEKPAVASEEADGPDGVAQGFGGGMGAKARPLAYIDVGPEGASIRSIMDEQKIALAGILLSAWAVGWLGLVLKSLFGRRK